MHLVYGYQTFSRGYYCGTRSSLCRRIVVLPCRKNGQQVPESSGFIVNIYDKIESKIVDQIDPSSAFGPIQV